jgi:hypothetical protein
MILQKSPDLCQVIIKHRSLVIQRIYTLFMIYRMLLIGEMDLKEKRRERFNLAVSYA